jgi:predicted ArsR family transcriptional regulator
MLIAMSDHEISRFKVLTDVREKHLRQIDAADILHISTQHVRRLLNHLATYGVQS